MAIIERLAGELNVAMDRLCLNTAIYYEEVGNMDEAYNYFRR